MTVDQSIAMELIHQVCQQPTPDWRALQSLVQDTPTVVEYRSPQDEWLPLHRVCRRQPSLAAVQTLVQAWPDSVREWTPPTTDQEGRLPIHLACQYGASLAVVQYLAHQDPTCLQAVSPKQLYTALDFALYYYHHRRQEGLDVVEAERVVSFLANARVQNAPEHWNQEKKQEQHNTPLPTVHARPVTIMATTTTPTTSPQETRPHTMRRAYPSYAPLPRPSYYKSNVIGNKNKTTPRAPGTSSKIIRLSTLRPAAPLR